MVPRCPSSTVERETAKRLGDGTRVAWVQLNAGSRQVNEPFMTSIYVQKPWRLISVGDEDDTRLITRLPRTEHTLLRLLPSVLKKQIVKTKLYSVGRSVNTSR